jgi:hypothetical protein
LPFSFDPVPPLKLWTLLAHGSHMPASMNNNISFLGFFLPLISGYLPFSLDPRPPLKRWGRCWRIAPTCQPLRTINISFLGFIVDP